MGRRNKILQIVRELEEKFSGIIAYAYFDSWWWICISDYNIYQSKNFKEYAKNVKLRNKVKICFAYCAPIEKELEKLAEQNNLILNI